MLKPLALYALAVATAVALAACCCPASDLGSDASSNTPKRKKKRTKKKRDKRVKPMRDIIGRWKCDKYGKTKDGKTYEGPCSKLAARFDLKITENFRYDFIEDVNGDALVLRGTSSARKEAYRYTATPKGKDGISLRLVGVNDAEHFRFEGRDTLVMPMGTSKTDGIFFRRTGSNPSGPLFPVRWVMDRPKATAENVIGKGECNEEGNVLVCDHERFGPFSSLRSVYEGDRMVGLTVDLEQPSGVDFDNDALETFGLDVFAADKQNRSTKTWNNLHGWDEVRLMSIDDGETAQRLRIKNYTLRMD